MDDKKVLIMIFLLLAFAVSAMFYVSMIDAEHRSRRKTSQVISELDAIISRIEKGERSGVEDAFGAAMKNLQSVERLDEKSRLAIDGRIARIREVLDRMHITPVVPEMTPEVDKP